jgi:glycosyltransferase involved in cell wall biosynthesis
MPKVSVVIPTYNRARLLQECLESVMSQSFNDFEIIIVDDGSTDNTSELVKKYPVKYVYQENQGAHAARNRGIALSKSEYIAFIDSDDIMLKDALKMGVEILDRHPEAGFSYGQGYIMDEEEKISKLLKAPWKNAGVRPGTEEIGELILGNHITSHTVVRHRCLDEVGGYNPDFKIGSMDYELWVRLAKKYAVAYLSAPVMKYRMHRDTITGRRSLDEKEKTRSKILEYVFTDPEIGPRFLPRRPKAYFHLYFNLAEDAYNRQQMSVSRYYLFKALKTYPGMLITSHSLSWVIQMLMTCLPHPILTFIRRWKHYYSLYVNKKAWHNQEIHPTSQSQSQ